jgi:hypothetical protein
VSNRGDPRARLTRRPVCPWSDLIRRGLLGDGPEMIGAGLLRCPANRRPGESPEAELPRTELAFADHPLVPVYLVFNAIPRRIAFAEQ